MRFVSRTMCFDLRIAFAHWALNDRRPPDAARFGLLGGFSKKNAAENMPGPVFHVRTGAVSGLDTVQPRQTEQISGIRYVGDPRDVVSGCSVYMAVSFAPPRGRRDAAATKIRLRRPVRATAWQGHRNVPIVYCFF